MVAVDSVEVEMVECEDKRLHEKGEYERGVLGEGWEIWEKLE